MNGIKKDDSVVVTVGKDKDKQGKVIPVDTKKNKVLVQGCSMATKHTKRALGKLQGGITSQEAPIDTSNVVPVVDDKVIRVEFEEKDSKKVCMAKTTGKVID